MGAAWHGHLLIVRNVSGRGGKSGLRYEVLLSSLPEPFQKAFMGEDHEPDTSAIIAHVLPPKFVAAPNQKATQAERYRTLRLIMETERGTAERRTAVFDASKHHDVPVRTIYRWIAQCEKHGWDTAALGRKAPTDSGKQRVWVSREFDRHFRAAGYAHSDLEDVAEWLERQIAGWWQSPVGRAGWKRVTRETLTSLTFQTGTLPCR